MPDREKVIADIEEQIAWIRDNDFHKFPGWGHTVLAMKDALDMLKEQPEIVLCKDCKYGVKSPTFQYYPEVTWCNKHSTSHNDEWFCADGEKESR